MVPPMPALLQPPKAMPRSVPLLLAVLALYMTAPLWGETRAEKSALAILLIFAFGFGGSLVAGKVRWWKWFGLICLLALLPPIGQLIRVDLTFLTPFSYSSTAMLGVLTLYVLHRFALFPEQGDLLDRILAAICAYLVMALVWAQMQEFILYFDPKAMTDGGKAIVQGDSSILYHSLVTLTTLGYGDVLPVNPYSRMLSGLEAASGTIYLAVIVASLVAEARQPKDVVVDLDLEKKE